MTLAELTRLPSYTNATYGRPPHPWACVVCAGGPGAEGSQAPMSAAGRCARCEARARGASAAIPYAELLEKAKGA